jgi:hypothetical protein
MSNALFFNLYNVIIKNNSFCLKPMDCGGEIPINFPGLLYSLCQTISIPSFKKLYIMFIHVINANTNQNSNMHGLFLANKASDRASTYL